MPMPDPFVLDLPPGVVLDETEYAAAGRYKAADGVRWLGGKWEKRGGWTKWIDEQLDGRPGAALAWRDLMGFRRLAAATNKKLYAVLGGDLINITPYSIAASTNLANAITTANGNPTVTIAFTAHGQKDGDPIRIINADEVGGVLLEGPYTVTVVDPDTFTVQSATNATSTAGPTGSLTVETFRGELTDPFTTTDGSPVVNVEHTAHGRGPGDTVYFDDASAVGGITIDGEYAITAVIDSDNYEITHSAAATSDAGPGGGTVTYFYELPIGPDTSTPAFGYGAGAYGVGTWGTPRASSITLEARVWSLDTFRDVLTASYGGGPIFEWVPDLSVRATQIPNAPATVSAHFVSEQLSLHALAPAMLPTTDRWSHAGDRYMWAPDDDNDARAREVQAPDSFIAGTRFRNDIAVAWTRSIPWIIQFTGDDYVYDLRQMAGAGGIAGKRSFGELDGTLYWMGTAAFYYFDGASFGMIDMRDVGDFVFRDINLAQADKFSAMVSRRFGEICFQYCSRSSDEIDRWVAIYPREGRAVPGVTCGYGTYPLRSAWVDEGVFAAPLGLSVDGYIYEHDAAGVLDGDGAVIPVHVRTGSFELENGARALDVMHIIPDCERLTGTLEVTIYSRDYPQGAETEEGTYEITSSTAIEDLDPRPSGRQFAIEWHLESLGSDVRLGRWRFVAQPGGER